MIEFNKNKRNMKTRGETRNFECGKAYEPQSPERGLYEVVVNNMLENSYYESGEESLEKVKDRFEKVAEKDPEFVLKLAEHARNELYLRSISKVLLVLSANNKNTVQFVEKYAPRIISRADELCDVLAIQAELFGKPMPSALLNGVERSLYNFDRYQYAKYFRTGKDWDFRDVLNVVRPNPETSERAQKSDTNYQEIFEKIIRGGLDDYPEVEPLDPPKTWEVVISREGNTKEAWRNVKDRMGLFALIRNARSMREAGLSGKEIFGEVDADWIRNAPLFPFRYYQSYKAIKERQLLDQYSSDFLQDAIDISTMNVPDFLENSLIGVDLSNSMEWNLSSGSNMTYKEIAALFGAITAKKGGEVWGFATDVKRAPIDPTNPVVNIQEDIIRTRVGTSTNAWKVIKENRGNQFDRIIMFTDMEIWDSHFGQDRSTKGELDKYREEFPETALYMINLESYGSLQTPEGYDKVFNISGWTDKIFDFIDNAENPEAVIQEIKG